MGMIVQVGFLGCGNVGSGVWRLLTSFSGEIAHRADLRFRVKKVLVQDLAKRRDIAFPDGVLTKAAEDVLDDPEISVVLEFLGGEEPAYGWMLRALRNGKTVVTANKVAFALHWHSLHKAAKENKAGLYYEAAVCGAIPIIHALQESLQANRIHRLYGIVNGTTNYILTRMGRDCEPYEAALREAQRLGLAEPDPSADVEGMDAAYKLSILASLAFHGRVPVENVYTEGITRLNAEDVRFGQELGYTLKLLAIAKREGLSVETRVHPTFIRSDHPLANVSGSFNAVFLEGHACQAMMFMGRGAGDMPTASAIVSDLVRAASVKKHPHPTFENDLNPSVAFAKSEDWSCPFYIRLMARDEPGVLSRVAGALAGRGVSVAEMRQTGENAGGLAAMVIITHRAGEQAVQNALRDIPESIASLESLIRVEE